MTLILWRLVKCEKITPDVLILFILTWCFEQPVVQTKYFLIPEFSDTAISKSLNSFFRAKTPVIDDELLFFLTDVRMI